MKAGDFRQREICLAQADQADALAVVTIAVGSSETRNYLVRLAIDDLKFAGPDMGKFFDAGFGGPQIGGGFQPDGVAIVILSDNIEVMELRLTVIDLSHKAPSAVVSGAASVRTSRS